MIKMSLQEASLFIKAQVLHPNTLFTGVSTDTRTLMPGNLFIAIRGPNFNGHDFIQEAFEKGASAALVDQATDPSFPQLIVPDTIKAFGQIASAWRSRFRLKVIGVTGTNGKTTLKSMIATILSTACSEKEVLSTRGTFNNEIGVPLMLCELNETHRYAIFEMGMNHFGEIAYLTELVKPDIAVITNAAEGHLEALKSIEGVARAKGEIFQGLSSQGIAVLNKDDPHYSYWANLTEHQSQLSFGMQHEADIFASTLQGQTFLLKTPIGETPISLPLLGQHNVMNALAAAAVSLALSVDLTTLRQGLEKLQPVGGRMTPYSLQSGTKLIDDTYNANPFSLKAAIATLTSLPGQKIFVLGDMRELGEDATLFHTAAGKNLREAQIDRLFTLGEMSRHATDAFGEKTQHFTEHEALTAALVPHLKPETTLLIKGSRSMKMEKIVKALLSEKQIESTH